MAEQQCENCKLRAKYDTKPKSILGRFWKWHITFCPGWKTYIRSQTDEKRTQLFERYGTIKY
jgi:hypothetical protein